MQLSASDVRAQPTGEPAFEVKGTIAPVTVLCLRTVDVAHISRELSALVERAPQLFVNAPIVIDFADVPPVPLLPLDEVIQVARGCKLIPVGVAHLPVESIALAAQAGLAVMQLGFGKSRMARAQSNPETHHIVEPPKPVKTADPPAPDAVAPNPTPEPSLTMTVRQPIRSGQVVYAKGGDLVVVAPVNPGAQVIADGHVHVYGPLRGRALAGAHGQRDARVFCQSLEADLVSIAGEFLSADDIPQKLRGKPAQIFIEHTDLRVLPLQQLFIGAAIEVHRHLGPGLLESTYEHCLAHELELRGVRFRRQIELPIKFKGLVLVDVILPVHFAQLRTYLQLGTFATGLLLNFNVSSLKHGICRLERMRSF